MFSARSGGRFAGFFAALPLPLAPWCRLGCCLLSFGRLFTARSLPSPPCGCVASLAALYAAFLATWRAGSLAALCAASLAARCTPAWPLGVPVPWPLSVPPASPLIVSPALPLHVSPPWPPCAVSLTASCATFLNAQHVCSFPARPVASLTASAGSPSASVFCRLPLPFLLVSWPGLSRWPPPYTGFSLLHSFQVSPLCGSLVLGLFTRLALQAWGHGQAVYFHRPQGPFGF